MPNTYTQIYVHVVFAVRGRRSLIAKEHREELFKYVTGITKRRKQKLLAINGMADHIHMLIRLDPTVVLSDLVRDIKAGSSGFINTNHWVPGTFSWQSGFGAFSHSNSEVDRVMAYIQGQEQHHKRRSFRDEYVRTLERFGVEYDKRYIFTDTEEAQGQAAPDGA